MADSPFPGPRSFTVSEKGRFFGREKETRDLTDLVLAYPLVVLSSQSGAGKTSLINAGLASRASAENALVLLSRVSGRVPPDRVGAIDNVFTYNCLCGLRRPDVRIDHEPPLDLERRTLLEGVLSVLRGLNLVEPVTGHPATRSNEAPADARIAPPRSVLSSQVIVVVDQFEEIFTSHQERWKDRQPFFRQLAGALAAIPDLHVLLALRDDYVSEMDPFAPLLPGSLRVRYRLERLREERAIDAIEKPIAISEFGYTLRTGIARAIVHDLLKTNVVRTPGVPDTGPIEGEFVEPVHLQVVCQSLWAAMQDAKQLSPEEATKLAADPAMPKNERDLIFTRREGWFRGEGATVTDVDRALRAMYDRAVAQAGRDVKGGEKRLRCFLGDEFITVGGTRGFIDVATAESQGVSSSALETLESHHILRREPRAGAHWYELTHDRFIGPVRTSNEAWEKQRRKPIDRAKMWGCLLITVAVAVGFVGKFVSERDRAQETADEARKAAKTALQKASVAQREAQDAKRKETETEHWSQGLAAENRDDFQLRQALANASNLQDLNKLKQAVTQDTLDPKPPGPDDERRNKARRYWNQGYERYLGGKPEQAVGHYKQAIKTDPGYAPAYNSLGVIEHNSLNFDEAAKLYEQTIARDPKYLPVYINYANLELMRHNPAKARTLAEKALTVRPNYGPAKRIIANTSRLQAGE